MENNNLKFDYLKGNLNNDINLVFIHGSGCDKRFLKELAAQIDMYNCYLLDLPGHGESNDTGYNFNNYVDSVCNFIKNLNNVILIGHSLGGTIVLQVLSKNFSNIRGAVVLNTASSFYKLDKEFMKKIHNGIVDMDYLMECGGQSSDAVVLEAMSNMDSETLIEDFLIDEVVDVESCLKDINVPLVIVTGGDEILALVEYSEHLHEMIKQSEMIIIPNTRHMLPISHREDVGNIIKEFVSKH